MTEVLGAKNCGERIEGQDAASIPEANQIISRKKISFLR